MKTVELVSLAATILGLVATIVAVRRQKPGPTPYQRWQARRAATRPPPE